LAAGKAGYGSVPLVPLAGPIDIPKSRKWYSGLLKAPPTRRWTKVSRALVPPSLSFPVSDLGAYHQPYLLHCRNAVLRINDAKRPILAKFRRKEVL